MPDPTARPLAGKTLIMSGGSRGIGLAIGVAAGSLGANVVLLAKTDVPDPRLPGTIHTAAAEIQETGGAALAVVGDVRDEASVSRAVGQAVERFGGIDICLNNASALALAHTEELSIKKFGLMLDIQLRGSFMLTKACLPYLRGARNPHVLTLSPPLNMAPHWLAQHPGYTVAKYGMTLLALGWAEEYRQTGVASNALWPESLIATAAVANLLGGDDAMSKARSPEIMADAAMRIVTKPAREVTGQCFLDVQVLRDDGITDLSRYGGGPRMRYDIYVDPPADGIAHRPERA